MRQQFNPENFNVWLQYYSDQADQAGYGFAGFRGMPYQRGAGLGSFFRSLFRMAVPVIKRAASSIGKQALASGANIAADLAEGRPVLESLEEHGRHGASTLLRKAGEHLQEGRGLGTRPKSIKAGEYDIYSKQIRKRRK